MNIAIVANGPQENIPLLANFSEQIDLWIGADRGALTLINQGISPNIAVGDFDSLTPEELKLIKKASHIVKSYPVEKDKTDLELALDCAKTYKPNKITLFGVTGGRLDHTIVNIHLLLKLLEQNINGMIIDKQNVLGITLPGKHSVFTLADYPYISFLPLTKEVTGLTLDGFYYSLTDRTVSFGSSLCISNKLIKNKGTFLYKTGILLVIRSRDL